MFDKSSEVYDRVYGSFKDYDQETSVLIDTFTQYSTNPPVDILEVACGTGQYVARLAATYNVTALDVDYKMISVARSKNLPARLLVADMLTFDLNKRFDVVLCMFSAIGYTKSVERLCAAIKNMASHVRNGGCLIVEPWLSEQVYLRRPVHSIRKPVFVDDGDMKIARMIDMDIDGRCSIMKFHYLVATDQGVEHFCETHELGLFTDAEYRDAFEQAGLTVTLSNDWPNGRGLYVGVHAGVGAAD